YYQIRGPADAGSLFDFFRASRADTTLPFQDTTPLNELNLSTANDTNLTVSADGLFAVFASDRADDAGVADLYKSGRASANDPFGTPSMIIALGVADPLATPFLTVDGKELWFSAIADGGQSQTTYVAPLVDGGFKPATARPDIEGWSAVLSDDKLTAYYAAGVNSATNAIRVAHRTGALEPFPPGSLVNEVNAGGDTPSWLSPDGCRLYFTTRRNTIAQIFVAERAP
ncbi:MAG: hypothetical protein ACRELY_29100, partial [Polyangiaceae bacterium]